MHVNVLDLTYHICFLLIAVERLEKIMKGIDPDDEMDEDNEMEDEDGGQEEYY